MLHTLLDKPLAVFDIESTGLNKKIDRIIDLAILRLNPDGSHDEQVFRVNPEGPIPPGSTAVHGITDADVANAPLFKDVAPQVVAFLENCDLAGFNAIRFDIPLLLTEFARVGVEFSMEGRRVLDAQYIFHKKEPRDLTAALQFYCDDTHAGAHGALDDVRATMRVMEAQLQRYTDLPQSMDDLHAFCNPTDPSWADREGKLKWEGNEILINFGQKTGTKLRDLAATDQGYLKWILKNDFPDDTKQIVRSVLSGVHPTPPEIK